MTKDESHEPIFALNLSQHNAPYNIIKLWRSKSDPDVKRNCLLALARISRTQTKFLANVLTAPEQKDVVRRREIMEALKIQ